MRVRILFPVQISCIAKWLRLSIVLGNNYVAVGTLHSVCHNLPNYQLNWLQQIQNSLARAVVNAPKSSHKTPVLKSLHWLKVNERIAYKLLSVTYKVLTTSKPSYLNNLISVQPPRSIRSSVVTLSRPPTISLLKITDRS